MTRRHEHQFGTKLKQFREAAGLSQDALAERTGLSARGISDLERGARRTPRLETVRMIADGLNLDDAHRSELLQARSENLAFTIQPPVDSTNLPISLTAFIGRTEEIESILEIITREDVRLLTLTGPGGVGKTRVAIEVAHQLSRHMDTDILFVDLAPVLHPQMLLSTIAIRLGVPQHSDADLRIALPIALRVRKLLIVLDNMEHLVTAAQDIAWILAACTSIKLLATSRIILRLVAEHVFPIDPFDLPTASDIGSIMRNDAVRLFVERARAADSRFEPSEDTVPAIVEIVGRLQGVPLAIELAAARVRVSPVKALSGQLNPQLPLLTRSSNDVSPRHRTMRDTIAWSCEHLSAAAQFAFRGLSIFPSGCTYETAIAVISLQRQLFGEEIIDSIEDLVDSSLLRAFEDADGQIRYRMLFGVREYGLEQLRALGEEEAVRLRAHSQWAIPLAQSATFVHLRPNLVATLNLLAAESQNLSEHVSWLKHHGLVHDALEISGSLASFRGLHGHFDEARSETGALLMEPANEAPSVARAKALVGMGIVGLLSDDTAGSIAMLQEAEAVARQVDASELLWMALYFQAVNMVYASRIEQSKPLIEEAREIAAMGNYPAHITHQPALFATISQRLGDWDSAFTHMQEAVRLAKQNDLTWFEAQFSRRLGFYYSRRGEFDLAEKLVIRAEHLNQELHSLCEIPHVQVMRGIVACRKGDPVETRVMAEKALASSREIGSIGGVSGSLILLSHVALIENRPTEALGILLEAIEWSERCGDVFDLVQSLDYLGDVAVAFQEPERAAWFVGAADNLVERNGIVREELVRGEHELLLRVLNQQISEAEFAAQYDRGRSMTFEEILAELRAWEPKLPDKPPA